LDQEVVVADGELPQSSEEKDRQQAVEKAREELRKATECLEKQPRPPPYRRFGREIVVSGRALLRNVEEQGFP
jgi:hypothetical protein